MFRCFLAEGDNRDEIMPADQVYTARSRLSILRIYDMRFSDPLKASPVALRERAEQA